MSAAPGQGDRTEMRITLKVWRQKDADAAGSMETYHLDDVSPDMSFLELLDVLNERLIREGGDPIAFDQSRDRGEHGPLQLFWILLTAEQDGLATSVAHECEVVDMGDDSCQLLGDRVERYRNASANLSHGTTEPMRRTGQYGSVPADSLLQLVACCPSHHCPTRSGRVERRRGPGE